MSMLTLKSPAFLLLLVPLALCAVPAGRSLAGRAASRRRVALVLTLRYAAFLLLILALAEPEAAAAPPAVRTIVVADTSASIDAHARQVELAWLRTLARGAGGAALQLVTFAGQPTMSALAASASDDWLRRRLAGDAGGAATDIAGAVTLALGAVPDGARIVLLSDGRQTTGDALDVALDARARQITIDPVLLPGLSAPDAAITRLAMPETAHAGDTLPMQITVWSNRSAGAVLTISQDGRAVGRQPVDLRPGESPFLVSLPAPAAGWHSFRAGIAMPGDSVPANDALDAVTLVAGAPRLLVVAQGAAGSPLTPLFESLGLQTTPISPDRFPRAAVGLGAYDGVVLDDISAAALDARQVAALDQAVRTTGIGLLVLGGAHSLTLGHYSQTPLERMLPVLSDTPNSLRQGNIALQLVLDRSGSMNDLAGDVPKIDMSRGAATIALDFAVQHKDQLGIVSFDIVPHLLFGMQPVDTRNAGRVRAIIAGMDADGGTDIHAALQLGLAQVLRGTAPYKHIILMTDGRSEPANYEALLNLMRKNQVTLSAVGLGSDADVSLLQYLAARGKGRFYYTANARDLPHIFAEEARLGAGSAHVTGTIGVGLGTSSPATRDLLGTAPPPVHGYVATVLKPEAQADLVSRATASKGDPVLAQWQYGLGRVLVWTPGSNAGWAGTWSGQRVFWNDVTRFMVQGARGLALAPRLLLAGTSSLLDVDTVPATGAFLDLLHLTATVTAPDGRSARLTLAQIAPGRYEAALADREPGVYRVSIGGGQAARATEALLAIPYAREYLPGQPDAALLRQVATATGGRMLVDPRQAASGAAGGGGEREYWWALAAVALALLALEMLIRLTDWGTAGAA